MVKMRVVHYLFGHTAAKYLQSQSLLLLGYSVQLYLVFSVFRGVKLTLNITKYLSINPVTVRGFLCLLKIIEHLLLAVISHYPKL